MIYIYIYINIIVLGFCFDVVSYHLAHSTTETYKHVNGPEEEDTFASFHSSTNMADVHQQKWAQCSAPLVESDPISVGLMQ